MWSIGLVVLDGYVYAVGGPTHWTCAKLVERYHADTNTWQLMESVGMSGNMPTDMNPGMVALEGLIYVLGREQIYGPVGTGCM